MIKKFTSIDEISTVSSEEVFRPQIAVIGVGGAGTNAVNNMINMELAGVKFVVINTDSQSLEMSIAPHKIQIGPKVTKGLGAGSKPEIGMQAAEESIEEIKSVLSGINMLFITAGMGGGTGTGASSVIAKIAKEMGILTIGFITKPFSFEGMQRQDIANNGALELEKYLDSLIVISNQHLFKVINDKTSMVDAFRVTDNVLYSGVKAITDLITSNGLVNLDFNDIKSVIEGMGRTMIGTSKASGEDRAVKVAQGAIFNPLLEDESVKGAKKILINISGGSDVTLYEIDAIVSTIREELDQDAFIHFGTVTDNTLENQICVCVVATGLQSNQSSIAEVYPYKDTDNRYARSESLEQKLESREKNYASSNSMVRRTVVKKPSSTTEQPSQKKDEQTLGNERHNEFFSSRLNDRNTNDHVVRDKDYSVPEQTFSNDMEYRNKPENHQSFDDQEEVEVTKENSSSIKNTNLFDLITNSRLEKKRNTAQMISEDKIMSIKNRNQPLEKMVEKEESFFDLPSFLKKK